MKENLIVAGKIGLYVLACFVIGVVGGLATAKATELLDEAL